MGRWVTSKGRRIYIPDEGEENPFTKEKRVKRTKEIVDYMEETGKGLPEASAHYRYMHPDEEATRDKANKQWLEMREKEKKTTDTISKNEDIKEKQIAANKKQAEMAGDKKVDDKSRLKPKEGFTTKHKLDMPSVGHRTRVNGEDFFYVSDYKDRATYVAPTSTVKRTGVGGQLTGEFVRIRGNGYLSNDLSARKAIADAYGFDTFRKEAKGAGKKRKK